MIKVAVCQLRTELEQRETMDKARRMVAEAAGNGADFVVLPEMFNCPYSSKYFHKYADLGHEITVEELSSWAGDNHVLLVGGSIPELSEGKLYNSCFVFGRDGRRLARHRKVHLFDVDIPGMRFKESATFAPGDEVTVFETEFGTMGCAVCFDLRFPELFRAMAVKGAKMIFLPAQFNMVTGPRHWEMSLRARAVDNELFLVAAAAARYEGFSYECWGHSMVVDPIGDIISAADEKERIIYADVDLSRVEQVRHQLPTFLNLRRDVYTVTE